METHSCCWIITIDFEVSSGFTKSFRYCSKCDLVLDRKCSPQFKRRDFGTRLVSYWLRPYNSSLIEDGKLVYSVKLLEHVWVETDAWPPGSPDFSVIEMVKIKIEKVVI